MPLKILLADDSTTAQKLGEKFLEGAGYEVVLVSNGAQALKKINSEKPDLAILDVVMPGYNGIEVCEKLRAAEATATLPVILTVGPMEKDAYKPADGERVKAEGLIVKPFVEKDLLAAVKKIEDKLAASQYEATQKLAPVEEVKDASYEEWKVTAPEQEEPAPTQAISVPDHMASSPAFGMDMLGDEHLTAPTQEIPAPDAGRITRALEMSRSAPPAPSRLEGLEPTIAEAGPEAVPGQDPALVTDRTEMASAFPTTFGNFGAEISVGVAADLP
ncbi:MAG: response regulator, partial [Nevskiales bacterium]